MKSLITIKSFTISIACLMVCFFQLNAQDPCEEGGYLLSTSSNPPNCYNAPTGTAFVASTGCDCMFSGCTYLWSDGQTFHTASGLVPGEYTVIVTHPDSCVMEISVVVEQAESFVQDVIVKPIYCHGATDGGITVIPTAENFNQLTYEWSTGAQSASIQNLAPGDYSVTVTDFGGCQSVEHFVIEAPATEELECVFNTKPACNGQNNGTIELFAAGGEPPYFFRLGNQPFQTTSNFENLQPGNYEVIMKDANDCTTSIVISVEEEEVNSPEINSGALEICRGQSTNLQAVSALSGLTYQWEPATSISNPSSNSVIATPEETTTYTLTVVDDTNCEKSTSITIEVTDCGTGTGLSSIESSDIRLFPNPVVSQLNIQVPNNTNYNLTVFDLSGRKVIEQNINTTQSINLEGFTKGIYLLTLENDEEQFFAKIVKD